MAAVAGNMSLLKLDGVEIQDNVFVIGEPAPIPGTNMLRALLNYHGALVTAELSIKFAKGENDEQG